MNQHRNPVLFKRIYNILLSTLPLNNIITTSIDTLTSTTTAASSLLSSLLTTTYQYLIAHCTTLSPPALPPIHYRCRYPWDKGLSFLRGGTITIASHKWYMGILSLSRQTSFSGLVSLSVFLLAYFVLSKDRSLGIDLHSSIILLTLTYCAYVS